MSGLPIGYFGKKNYVDVRVEKDDLARIRQLIQDVDAQAQEKNGPWTRLKQTLQAILTFSAEVVEEVAERNSQDEREFVAEAREEGERLRQNAALQHQANQIA